MWLTPNLNASRIKNVCATNKHITDVVKNQATEIVRNCVIYFTLCVDVGLTLYMNTSLKPNMPSDSEHVPTLSRRFTDWINLKRLFQVAFFHVKVRLDFFEATPWQKRCKRTTWFREALPPIAQFRLVAATFSLHISRSSVTDAFVSGCLE